MAALEHDLVDVKEARRRRPLISFARQLRGLLVRNTHLVVDWVLYSDQALRFLRGLTAENVSMTASIALVEGLLADQRIVLLLVRQLRQLLLVDGE